jgi:2-dehydro-3-deoxygalactonokinase
VNPLLAVDWGSSTLRGVLLDASDQLVQERAFARGILNVPPGGFAQVFDECFGDWMQTPGIICLMSGMVGSRQGWREAPYCACPAGFAEITARLTWLEPGRIALVPGLSCEHPGLSAVPGLVTIPDVMRGEETQILGALQLLGIDAAIMVLPGTHSKWARVRARRIESFSTFMTGEIFSLLTQHSILARTLPASTSAPDDEAFVQGVGLALRGPGLLSTAFSVRTLALFERLPAAQRHDFLSGLVIGEELRSQPLADDAKVVLIGAADLTRRYQTALALKNVSAQCTGPDATWTGLRAIAKTLSSDLLPTP